MARHDSAVRLILQIDFDNVVYLLKLEEFNNLLSFISKKV